VNAIGEGKSAGKNNIVNSGLAARLTLL